MASDDNVVVHDDDIMLNTMDEALGLPAPSAPRVETFVVELCPDISGTLKSLVDAIFGLSIGSRLTEVMDKDLVGRYLVHLLASRVRRTSGEVVDDKKKDIRQDFDFIRFNQPGMVIPAIWVVVLNHVGRVVNHTFGIDLTPRLVLPHGYKFLSHEELLNVWSWLAKVSAEHGLEVGNSYSRNPTGDEQFMTFQVVGDMVKHHTADASRSRAFLASFMVQNSLQSVFIPRIEYLNRMDARSYVRAVIRPRGNKG